MKHRLRGPAALALATLAALGATGCSVFSPVQTTYPYEPGDGFSTEVGDVLVRNAVVVSEGEGAPGVFSATLVNNTDQEAEVTITPEGGTETTVSVPVGAAVVLSDGDAAPRATEQAGDLPESPEPAFIQIASVDAVPGELVDVTVEADGQSGKVSAPVMLPRHEYAPYTPTPTAGSPTSTPTGAADEPTSPADRTDATDDPEPLATDGAPTSTSEPTRSGSGQE